MHTISTIMQQYSQFPWVSNRVSWQCSPELQYEIVNPAKLAKQGYRSVNVFQVERKCCLSLVFVFFYVVHGSCVSFHGIA